MSCFVNIHGHIILKLVELKGRYGGGGVGGEGKIGLFSAGEGVMDGMAEVRGGEGLLEGEHIVYGVWGDGECCEVREDVRAWKATCTYTPYTDSLIAQHCSGMSRPTSVFLPLLGHSCHCANMFKCIW